VLNIHQPLSWNLCPVLLPFSPHTISTILPGYLGILIPFLVFDIFFFMYLYSIFDKNFHADLTYTLQSYQSDRLLGDNTVSSYGKSASLRYGPLSHISSVEDGE